MPERSRAESPALVGMWGCATVLLRFQLFRYMCGIELRRSGERTCVRECLRYGELSVVTCAAGHSALYIVRPRPFPIVIPSEGPKS